MIILHRLNGMEVAVTVELIETLEPGPQTVLHLATGNKVLVREGYQDVIDRVVDYRKKVYSSGAAVNPIAKFERTGG